VQVSADEAVLVEAAHFIACVNIELSGGHNGSMQIVVAK
jgi:hypothetical protein